MSAPRRPGDDRRAGRSAEPRDRRDAPPRGNKPAGDKSKDGEARSAAKPPRMTGKPRPEALSTRPPRDYDRDKAKSPRGAAGRGAPRDDRMPRNDHDAPWSDAKPSARPTGPSRAASVRSARENSRSGRLPQDKDAARPARSYGARPDRDGAPSTGRAGRPPRDTDSRPPRSYGDRPDRAARPDRDGAPSFGRSNRPSRDGDTKPARSFGDRPDRAARPDRDGAPSFGRSNRPSRDGDAKPPRAFGDRPDRAARPDRDGAPSFGSPNRPPRDGEAKPARAFGDRPDRAARPDRDGAPSFGRSNRPPRDGDAKPARSFGDRPERAPRPDRGAAPASARPARALRPGDARPSRPVPRPERDDAATGRRDGKPVFVPSAEPVEAAAPAIVPAPAVSGKREPQRIAKLLARAGIASRREIERMIEEGRIAVAGVAVDKPATLLTSLHGVTVDGELVAAAAPARLFLFHKPTGYLTTERDPAGRPTIYDKLPEGLPRVMPVGRLDLNTEGLLLLTTDGELKRKLELPSSKIPRVYRARAYGEVTQEQLEDLMHGVEIEGIRYGSIDANMERRTGRNVWIEMRITEGKNREVRRVLEYLGLQVSRLIRVAYGEFVLADLPSGELVEVRQNDLVNFRQTLR